MLFPFSSPDHQKQQQQNLHKRLCNSFISLVLILLPAHPFCMQTKANISSKDLSQCNQTRELLRLHEAIESVNLDSTSVILKRRQMTSNVSPNSKPSANQIISSLCDPKEKPFDADNLIDRLATVINEVTVLDNVVAVWLADVLSAVKSDVGLGLKVLSFMKLYYGRLHPRTALQLTLVAMMASEDVHLKQKLLIEARDICCILLPSVSEMQSNNYTISNTINPAPSLLSVIEKELTDAQEEIRSRASVERVKKLTHGTEATIQSSQSSFADYFHLPYAIYTNSRLPANFLSQRTVPSGRYALPWRSHNQTMTSNKQAHGKSFGHGRASRRDVISLSHFVHVY
jgi:hypothetical protein